MYTSITDDCHKYVTSKFCNTATHPTCQCTKVFYVIIDIPQPFSWQTRWRDDGWKDGRCSFQFWRSPPPLSPYCCRITLSGSSSLTMKWWYSFIPTIFLKCGFRNALQSYIGMTSDPSSLPASWRKLCSEDALTRAARLSRVLTHVLQNFCFSKSTLRFGENFVWLTSKNDKGDLLVPTSKHMPHQVVCVKCDINTHVVHYGSAWLAWIIALFLFWHTQLSALR